jgi:predicted dehydrogenase
VPLGEPLKFEAQHFLECVRDRTRPRTDGLNGIRVLEVIEAIEASIRSGGASRRIDGAGS